MSPSSFFRRRIAQLQCPKLSYRRFAMHLGDRTNMREDFAFGLLVCREVSDQVFLKYLVFYRHSHRRPR
jgi:hypothetical protein